VSAAICFGLGLLSKESVIAMPVLALIGRPRGVDLRRQLVRVAPMAGTALAFAALFAFLPPAELAPGGSYAMAFQSNVFHNAMTYLSWSIDLWRPLPDLVSSFDVEAWRLGLPIAVVLVLALILTRARDVAVVLGTMWWLAGILPVLALVTQTYRHYMYASQPGFAIAAAAIVIGTARSSLRIGGLAPGSAARAAGACAGVVAVLYAWQAGRLIDHRLAERVEGGTLALDPIVRRREVAQNAIRSLREALGPQPVRLAILMYGPRTILGARSGKQYTEIVGARAYSLLEASTDNGRTIRLFFPQVDTVVFLDRWRPEYDDFVMVLPLDRGNLQLIGQGPEAHLLFSRWLLDSKEYRTAAEHLGPVLERYPEDADLRMLFAAALARLEEDAESKRQLEEVVRTPPAGATRTAAESLLRRVTPPSR